MTRSNGVSKNLQINERFEFAIFHIANYRTKKMENEN